MKKQVAVFIGRFQPFHNVHLQTVREALKLFDKLIIVIGSSYSARTIKNPFTSREREKMITSCLTSGEIERVQFVFVRDYLYNDGMWVASVQQAINEISRIFDEIVIVGHKKDKSSFYLDLFPKCAHYDTGYSQGASGTQVRRMFFEHDTISIKNHVPEPVFNFLAEFEKTQEYEELYAEYQHILEYKNMWSGSPFPPMFVTTDAVVICCGHILVVRRKCPPGKGLIALPGGFLKQDEKIFDGCLRELKEETGIKVNQQILRKQVIDERVFDHPDRSLRGRTITHAYCFHIDMQELPSVKGNDDADKAWWMPISDVFARGSEFFEDHVHIIRHFVNKF